MVPLPEGTDPAELVEREGAEALQERVRDSVPFVVFEVERILARADLRSAEGRDWALHELRPALDELPASVLLVDDKPANLLSLEAILAPLGQDLVKAGSGEEALRHLLEQDFAVVLLDVQMPGLDGLETARRIRAREQSRHVPIIFITAYDSSQFPVAEAYRLGAVDILSKPLVPLRQDLEGVPARLDHHVEDLLQVSERDLLVKEVAHRVDEDEPGPSPTQRGLQSRGPEPLRSLLVPASRTPVPGVAQGKCGVAVHRTGT